MRLCGRLGRRDVVTLRLRLASFRFIAVAVSQWCLSSRIRQNCSATGSKQRTVEHLSTYLNRVFWPVSETRIWRVTTLRYEVFNARVPSPRTALDTKTTKGVGKVSGTLGGWSSTPGLRPGSKMSSQPLVESRHCRIVSLFDFRHLTACRACI